MRITHELTIAAPPERVFALLNDADRVPEWRPSIAGIVDRNGPMDQVGTTFTTRYHGRTPDSHGRVVASEAPRRQVLAGEGAVRYEAATTIDPDGASASRLRFDLSVQIPGGPVGRLAERAFLRKKVERETGEELARLKALAEREA